MDFAAVRAGLFSVLTRTDQNGAYVDQIVNRSVFPDVNEKVIWQSTLGSIIGKNEALWHDATAVDQFTTALKAHLSTIADLTKPFTGPNGEQLTATDVQALSQAIEVLMLVEPVQ